MDTRIGMRLDVCIHAERHVYRRVYGEEMRIGIVHRRVRACVCVCTKGGVTRRRCRGVGLRMGDGNLDMGTGTKRGMVMGTERGAGRGPI